MNESKRTEKMNEIQGQTTNKDSLPNQLEIGVQGNRKLHSL